MKTVQTKPVHASFKKDLAKFLETYDDKLSAEEMLAVTSQVVGMMVAMQDQTKSSVAKIMEVVSLNIQTGNASAIAELLKDQGKLQ